VKKFTWIALAVALVLAACVSPFACGWFDGLERVAEDLGFLAKGEGPPLINSPLPDYVFPGIGSERVGTGIAGIVGTLAVFGVAFALAAVLRKRNSS
jgi:cobalt/nickel transport protein